MIKKGKLRSPPTLILFYLHFLVSAPSDSFFFCLSLAKKRDNEILNLFFFMRIIPRGATQYEGGWWEWCRLQANAPEHDTPQL